VDGELQPNLGYNARPCIKKKIEKKIFEGLGASNGSMVEVIERLPSF
jgi:hypothetical protein